MKLTTILFWQVLLILLAALIGVPIAAQWSAAALDYSPRLGSPWFTLFEVRIYPPWRFFAWWYAFNAYAPEVFDRAGLIAAGGGFAGLAVAIMGAALRARESRRVTTYGSSRWAEPADVRRAGLFDASGVFLGQYKGCYLRHDGPSYISGDLAEYLEGKGMKHTRGAPYHPQTQGKIERWHQTLKNRILRGNYFLPGDLEAQIDAFVGHYNHRRYHESLNNLTPADVYTGRGQTILLERETTKRRTMKQRRLQHAQSAA